MPESKPIKKQIEKIDRVTYPFSLPQTWDEDAQDWKITSKKNPLPSGNFFLKGNLWVPVSEQDPLPVKQEHLINRLEAIEDTLENVIENGAVNTRLTGSNVEVVKAFINDTSLTDLTNRRYGDNVAGNVNSIVPIDYTKFKRYAVFIHNTTDVAITLKQVVAHFETVAGGQNLTISKEPLNIPAGSKMVYEDKNTLALGLSVQIVRGGTPPSSGGITLLFLGGAN